MAHKLPLNDIRFLADFAAFARNKGDEEYKYIDVHNCALSQFMRDTRRETAACGVYRFGGHGQWQPANGSPLLRALIGRFGRYGRETFAALADRLEALIADAPVVVKP